MIWRLVFYVVLLLEYVSAQCNIPPPWISVLYCGCGCVYKTDQFLLVGDYLNLTCVIKKNESIQQGDNSSKLYFEYGEKTVIPASETYILDDSSLRLHRLIKDGYNYNGTYTCFLKDPVSVNKKAVHATTVTVDYPPHMITNFRCIIYDWDERMVCTWDLGVGYIFIKNINVTLTMDKSHCPAMEMTMCTWNKSDGIVFDKPILNFTVNVTNTKVNVFQLTENLSISYVDNVKPSNVDYFGVKNVTSTCVTLEWNHPRKLRTKYFIIRTTSKWNDSFVTGTSDFNKTICNLIPNTMYDLSIVTVPEEGRGYESDPEFNLTFTDKDVPSHPPEIIDNNFFIDKEDCTNNNERSITVHWKMVPEIYQSGKLIGYYISISNFKGSLLQQYYISNTRQLQQSFKNLPCNQEMVVSLKSWGELGLSMNSSTIVIPEANYLGISEIAGISVGGFVLVSIVIVVIVVLCRRQIQKMKEPYPIDDIPIKLSENGNAVHINTDSGKGSSLSVNSNEHLMNGHYEILMSKQETCSEGKSTLYSSLNSNSTQDIKSENIHTKFKNKMTTGANHSDQESISRATSLQNINQNEGLHASSSESMLSSSEKFILDSTEDVDGYLPGVNKGCDSQDDVSNPNDENMVSYVVHGESDSTSDPSEISTQGQRSFTGSSAKEHSVIDPIKKNTISVSSDVENELIKN